MRFKWPRFRPSASMQAPRGNPVVHAGYVLFAGSVCALMAIGVACKTPVDTSPTVQPTLSSIQQNVFAKSCNTSSCHNAFGHGGGLVLDSGKSFSNLVNAPSINDSAYARHLLRVNPGKPDSSFLLIKLRGPRSDEGVPMPNKGGSLSADQISAVRQWILDGAKNN